jgi:hypothetical protein
VATWSDGRSWLKVEVTEDWDEPSLFGLSVPFVDPVDLGAGSVGYFSPSRDSLALHGANEEVLVSGSVSEETLAAAASSLGVQGREVPSSWLQASTVTVDELPAGTLVPEVAGWSILARIDEQGDTTLLLTGGGTRNVVITQSEGTRLDPPIGPDFSQIEVRGTEGRHDLSASTLEWVEDGRVLRMQSETVDIHELLELAATMEPR